MKSMLDALRGAVLGDERLLTIAGERLGAREYALAARDARTVLGRHPDHPQALETLAAALLGLDGMDGATDAWRRGRRSIGGAGRCGSATPDRPGRRCRATSPS
jgi:hypothetical protein